MYLEKLTTLSSTMRKARMFTTNYKRDSSLYTQSYDTRHENFIVEIVKPRDIDREDDISIKFKNSSSKEEFRINFNNDYDFDSYGNDITRNSLSLFINNSQIKDEKIVNQLLEKVKFESFLDKEIEISQNQYNQLIQEEFQKNKEEQLKLERATKELLSKLDKMNQTSSGDINKFKELISNINKHNIANFFTLEKNKKDFLSHNPTVKYLQDNFDNYKIFYKKSSNHFGDDQKTEILVSNKEIKFEVIFQEYNYSCESTDQKVYLKIDGKVIYDNKIISDAIGKTGLVNYLESLHNKVKTLDLAQYAERSISSSIEERLNTIKAQELLDKLANKPIDKNLDFDTMPIEINGTKVWLNKDLKLDRKDGPAVEDFNGRDFWFKNGIAYLPDSNQEIIVSENESRKYNSNMPIKEENTSSLNKSSADEVNPHNMGISRLVDKLRNIFSSEDKNKKPKM